MKAATTLVAVFVSGVSLPAKPPAIQSTEPRGRRHPGRTARGTGGIGPRRIRFVYKGRCWCRRHLDGYEVSRVLCYLFCAHFELISPFFEPLLFFVQPSRFCLILLRLFLRRCVSPQFAALLFVAWWWPFAARIAAAWRTPYTLHPSQSQPLSNAAPTTV